MLNRRDFLKLSGALAVVPAALLQEREKTEIVIHEPPLQSLANGQMYNWTTGKNVIRPHGPPVEVIHMDEKQ